MSDCGGKTEPRGCCHEGPRGRGCAHGLPTRQWASGHRSLPNPFGHPVRPLAEQRGYVSALGLLKIIHSVISFLVCAPYLLHCPAKGSEDGNRMCSKVCGRSSSRFRGRYHCLFLDRRSFRRHPQVFRWSQQVVWRAVGDPINICVLQACHRSLAVTVC